MLLENLKIFHIIKSALSFQTQQGVYSRFYTRMSRISPFKLNNKKCKNQKARIYAIGEAKPINWSLLDQMFVGKNSVIVPNAQATYDFRPQAPRRQRTFITTSQIVELKNEFKKNPYLKGNARVELSSRLNLPIHTVQFWFQNQRQRLNYQEK